MNIAGWLFHPSTEHEEVVEPANGVIAGAWSCDTAVSADVTAASKHRLPANSRPPAGRQAPFEAHWQALRSGADTKLLLILFIYCLNDTTSRKKCTVWSITFLVCFPVLKIKKTRMLFLRLACINNSIYLCLILVNGLGHYVFGLSFRLCVLHVYVPACMHAYPGVTILQLACHRLSVTLLLVRVWSIAISMLVCLTVCLCISKTSCPNFTTFSLCVSLWTGHGLVLLIWQCCMLCTAVFVDDVMFFLNQPGKGDASKTYSQDESLVWIWYSVNMVANGSLLLS